MRFDGEQRFTCQQCGRCCRLGFRIPLLASEVADYRTARAERWFRESGTAPEGTRRSPWVHVGGTLHRLRKRPDGTCGFLSPQGRCRLHEELGFRRKPLACRLFPFRVHDAGGEEVLTASFSCPTVARNDGAPVASQVGDVARLGQDWRRAFPAPPRAVRLDARRDLGVEGLAVLRRTLAQLLDRVDPDLGRADLRANVGCMAAFLEDLLRPRVARLAPDAFLEYLTVMGRAAVERKMPPSARPPSALGRLSFRGFLFGVLALRHELDGRAAGTPWLARRGATAGLLLHAHGLWPAVAGVDLARARRRLRQPEAGDVGGDLLHRALRSSVATLGTGRWAVVTEMGVAVATVNAALTLVALRPDAASSEDGFVAALTEASDLQHAEAGLGRKIIGALAGGVEALALFASGSPL